MDFITPISSRYESTEESVTCMIRILRDGVWQQLCPLIYPRVTSERIISRLRCRGEVRVTWLCGMF